MRGYDYGYTTMARHLPGLQPKYTEAEFRQILDYYRHEIETAHEPTYWQGRHDAVLAYCRQYHPVLAMEYTL